MKLSTVFTAFVVVLPLFSGQALAAATQGNNKGTGKGAGSKGAAPPAKNNAASNNAASNKTVSNNAASNKGASNKAASNNAASNNTASNTANNAASANNGNAQDSLTLLSSVINTGSQADGLNNATAGTTASDTSNNNFINVCDGKTITDGLQNKAGSCNPIPMGDIPAVTAMPSCKFVSPANGQNFGVNQTFNAVLAVQGMQDGDFTNAETTYFAAPQKLNAGGQIIGHNHVVIEAVKSFTDTTPTNPQVFAFFKGYDDAAAGGQLTAPVTNGLDAGTYRCCSITTSANHVPVAVPVAQHGTVEDCVYFSVGDAANSGNPFSGSGAAAGNAGNNNNVANNGNSTATGNAGNNKNNAVNTGNSTATGNAGNNKNNAANTGSSTAAGNTGNTKNNAANSGNSTTAGNTGKNNNAGNTNNAGKNGGNANSGAKTGGNANNNAGKNGGNASNQGNKGAGGRRRMLARLARDH